MTRDAAPSRWYYVLAALPVLVGASASGVLLFRSLTRLDEALQQVVLPGRQNLYLAEPGGYTIFYEQVSAVGGRVFSIREEGVAGLTLRLASKSTGQEVPLRAPDFNSSYTLPGREGTSVFRFDIAEPGWYELSGEYDPPGAGSEAVFAIGAGFEKRLFGIIGGFLAAVAVSALLSVGIGLWIWKRRRRALQIVT
ncbi:MAG: hypothetical protein HY561_06945 [Gemmatimonadetes bacterium]|nr:hypothetical protein [Gemmatimonadota bacterium]